MTPYNLVNMAAISELDFIALTDHNTCKNCPAAYKAAQEAGITLICGMELCTSEEIHIVCLFPNLQSAMEFDKYIYTLLPDVENKPEIFGEQLILNETEDPGGKRERRDSEKNKSGLYWMRLLYAVSKRCRYPYDLPLLQYEIFRR